MIFSLRPPRANSKKLENLGQTLLGQCPSFHILMKGKQRPFQPYFSSFVLVRDDTHPVVPPFLRKRTVNRTPREKGRRNDLRQGDEASGHQSIGGDLREDAEPLQETGAHQLRVHAGGHRELPREATNLRRHGTKKFIKIWVNPY